MNQIKVELVDHMGSDLTVCNAAKGCYGKSTDKVDEKLIKHLVKKGHWNPFGHPQVTLYCHAPIFVWRQVTRSRQGLKETGIGSDVDTLDVTTVTETSRRYTKGGYEIYDPDWRCKRINTDNYIDKQVIGGEWNRFKGAMERWIEMAEIYGVPAEQLRVGLPVALMTSWYWTGSLAAFARVCRLRLDSHAQKESQEFAKQISDIMVELYPVSWRYMIDL